MPLCGCLSSLFGGSTDTNKDHSTAENGVQDNSAYVPSQNQVQYQPNPAPITSQLSQNQKTYIVLYDYEARMPDDLAIQQGDRLIILDERYILLMCN